MDDGQKQAWARELVAARDERRTIDPISDRVPLSMSEAYAIQLLVTQAALDRGQRIVGWKLGYTSQAMREQMGVDEPNFGPLTDAMVLASGDAVSPVLSQPRVEPEIALRFGRPVGAGATVDGVLEAVDEAIACLEVVNSVYTGYRFTIADNTADQSSAAQVVLGPALPAKDGLDLVQVRLEHSDGTTADATGAAASGHPAAGVVWLLDQLGARGRRIEAGDVVITGGLTKALPLGPGETISATFDNRTTVVVHRT